MSEATIPAPWTHLDYYDSQRYKCVGEVEEAWAKDDRATNYRLKDGDKVILRHSTIGEGRIQNAVVPAGAEGVVIQARTPRVTRRKGKGSLYFANVKVTAPDHNIYRVRVPHSALRIVR